MGLDDDQPNTLILVDFSSGNECSSFFNRVIPSSAIFSAVAREFFLCSLSISPLSASAVLTLEYIGPTQTHVIVTAIAKIIATNPCTDKMNLFLQLLRTLLTIRHTTPVSKMIPPMINCNLH